MQAGAWLDLGTGPGWIAVHAASGNPDLDVVGIDTSSTMLELAEANKRGRLNVTLRRMDAGEVIYTAETFDVVTAVQVAHHWPEPANILAEAHRVLKVGGKLYLYEADPASEVPQGWIARWGPWPPDAWVRRQWARYGMDEEAWNRLMEAVRASPFGDDVVEERHGFYRRAVCTR